MEKNALTEEQQAFLEENLRTMKEQDLFEKLAELGPEVDERTFAEAIRAVFSKAEEEVFSRNVSEDELANTSGGDSCSNHATIDCPFDNIEDSWHCIKLYKRMIYYPKFPNCAKSVEEGSWCGENDACLTLAVQYNGMTDCHKSWR